MAALSTARSTLPSASGPEAIGAIDRAATEARAYDLVLLDADLPAAEVRAIADRVRTLPVARPYLVLPPPR